MKILKYLVGAAAIGAATAAIVTKTTRDKKRKEELDDFLMPEADDAIVLDIPRKGKDMVFDILSWKKEPENILPITLLFSFENFIEARKFQDEVALLHISSSVDEEKREIEILYSDDLTEDSLNAFANELSKILSEVKVTYQGYHYFAK